MQENTDHHDVLQIQINGELKLIINESEEFSIQIEDLVIKDNFENDDWIFKDGLLKSKINRKANIIINTPNANVKICCNSLVDSKLSDVNLEAQTVLGCKFIGKQVNVKAHLIYDCSFMDVSNIEIQAQKIINSAFMVNQLNIKSNSLYSCCFENPRKEDALSSFEIDAQILVGCKFQYGKVLLNAGEIFRCIFIKCNGGSVNAGYVYNTKFNNCSMVCSGACSTADFENCQMYFTGLLR